MRCDFWAFVCDVAGDAAVNPIDKSKATLVTLNTIDFSLLAVFTPVKCFIVVTLIRDIDNHTLWSNYFKTDDHKLN